MNSLVKNYNLDFDVLLTILKGCVSNIEDYRAVNTSYSLQDVFLSAFAMFYTQDASFLAFQKRMEKKYQKSNARNIFGINDIPTDSQIRNVLDKINPNQLNDVFESIFDLLYNSGKLNEFKFLNDQLLIALDGTNCYHSTKVKCDNCLKKTYKKGHIRLLSNEDFNFKAPIKEGKEIVIIKNTNNQLKIFFQRKKSKIIDTFTIKPESEIFSSLTFDGEILERTESTENIYNFIYGEVTANKGFIPYKKKLQSAQSVTAADEYYHSILTPIIVSPNQSQIISLSPEHITNLDGGDKQDCERNAAKRWLNNYGDKYGKLNSTILGDDLFCCEPICNEILKKNLNFIFTCKNSSHKSLYEFINFPNMAQLFSKKEEVITIKNKEITNTYKYLNNVPIKKGDDSLRVNWFEIISTNSKGDIIFYGTYVTNHKITHDNIAELAIAARSRWKVENENNNTLKTKGYHMEHNFGHSKKYLAMLLASLNILAFLFHSILELLDHAYQAMRKSLGARIELFNYIRITLMHFIFNGWKNFIEYALKNLEIENIKFCNSG